MEDAKLLTITAADGHSFGASIYAADAPTAPVLVFMSALGTPSRVYGRFAREMAAQGVTLCAPDWRGIDSSSIRAGRRSDFGYRHLLELDLAALVAQLHTRFLDAPIWLGGHSLGGQLALLGATNPVHPIAGVVLIASCSVHAINYKPKLRWGIRFLTMISRLTGFTLGYFPGARLGFGGREAAGLMRDWSHVARTGDFSPEGSALDYEQGMRQLTLPVLALSFEADSWAPSRAVREMLGKLRAAEPEHLYWGQADTQGLALDHFSWLKQPTLVAPSIARFILDHA